MEEKLNEEALKGHIKLETELLYNPLVTDYLKSNFGENSIKIIAAAMEEMTDDAIAARCKLKVAEVRAVLNKLYNYRMAEYKRIKDRDTGWFSYLWKIDVSNILVIIKEQTAQRISELDTNLEKISTEFVYYCPQCSKTNLINFDLAADMMFRCPNCENKLLEKEGESKEDYEKELKELKSKHLSLLEDITRFEELKRQEEMRIKELQEKMVEMSRIEEVSNSRKSKNKNIRNKRAKQRAKQRTNKKHKKPQFSRNRKLAFKSNKGKSMKGKKDNRRKKHAMQKIKHAGKSRKTSNSSKHKLRSNSKRHAPRRNTKRDTRGAKRRK